MRIIAGQFRGRRLAAPRGQQTRPITDRVKVSLFSMLDPYLPEAAVADLFCGSGSFGLEALSRGARHCWFAELDPAALAALRENVDMLGVGEQVTIWRGDILRRLEGCLGSLPGPLDVISLDPPFDMARGWFGLAARRRQSDEQEAPPVKPGEQAARQEGRRLLTALAAVLAPEGLISVRTPHNVRIDEFPAGLIEDRRREYGVMALTFLRKSTAESGRPPEI
jgi:16S rRNA (guanine966-N2)-methyltransferase